MRGVRRCLVFAAVTLLGCDALTGVDFGSVRSLDELPSGCVLAKPPAPPTLTGATGNKERTVVLVDYDFGEAELEDGTPGYLAIGYDLDGSCGFSPADQPCQSPDWVGADLVDGPGGIDNGVGRMLFTQESTLGAESVSIGSVSERVNSGELAPVGVLRISDFYGYDKDDRVTVEWFVPLAPLSQEPPFEPALDGGDAWPIADEYADEDMRATFVDEAAYENENRIVANFPRILLSMLGTYIEVEDVVVSLGVFEGEITDGLLAARTSEAVIWAALPVWGKVWTQGEPLCRDAFGKSIKQTVCTMVDLPGASAGGVCEHLSLGMRFDTRPVTLGAALPLPEPEELCEEDTKWTGERCADPPE